MNLNKTGLLEKLINEGLFTKNIIYNDDATIKQIVYITYDRLCDHLIANYIIERFLLLKSRFLQKIFNKNNKIIRIIIKLYLISCFKIINKLKKTFKNPNDAYYNKGLLEALSIQLPEKINFELFEVLLKAKKYKAVIEAFIESISWRKKETFSNKLLEYINHFVFKYHETFNLFMETLITLSGQENHYFNSDRLHFYLMKLTLADRDAQWSIFLHYRYEESNPVKRIIDWACNEDNMYYSDEAIRLTSKMITWFLTSTNRKLRDISTKALIVLLENKINILIKILEDFKHVNDPYVYERLYAVAYGCVLKTKSTDNLKELSEYIYNSIFNVELVYPHFLLRDYSRGIIEYTLYLGIDLQVDINKIKPPYKSIFPDIPSDDEINKYEYDYKAKDFKDFYWSQNAILSSMEVEYSRDGKCAGYGDFGRYIFQSNFRDWEELNPVDLKNITIKRIFELGYDVNKHGEFDRRMGHGRGRETPVAYERIGKKYQWIAMCELLAQVSDKYKMKAPWSWGKDKEYIQCLGPWEPYVRNIDPSLLLKKKCNVEESLNSLIWSNRETYKNWKPSHEKWIKIKTDIINPSNFMLFKDNQNQDWLALSRHIEFSEPEKIGLDQWSYPHKKIWYLINSYICNQTEYNVFFNWAVKQNFMGKWMPEAPDRYEIFYREYYWSPAYDFFQNKSYFNGNDWHDIYDNKTKNFIAKTHIPITNYLWESEYDCSKEEGIRIVKPSKYIFELMNLHHGKNDGEFINKNNEIICFDSYIYNKTQYGFFIHKKYFFDFLKKNKLNIIWTVIGEKQIVGGEASYNRQQFKWLEFSGAYKYLKNKIDGNLNFRYK